MNIVLNTIPERPVRSPYSAKDMAKPVHFYYAKPDAKSVSLIGDFNKWRPNAHPLRRREDGWWFVEAALTHGHHQYLFLVDGVPTLDPRAAGTAQVDGFPKASLIAVS
jgi:1,4-alpha-glucan branching enzyme